MRSRFSKMSRLIQAAFIFVCLVGSLSAEETQYNPQIIPDGYSVVTIPTPMDERGREIQFGVGGKPPPPPGPSTTEICLSRHRSDSVQLSRTGPSTKSVFPVTWLPFHVPDRHNPNVVGFVQINNGVRKRTPNSGSMAV